jgi:DNA invertase Pin-like site-specific DNA recombinase
MSTKITDQHRQKMACVYLRQSTQGQLRHHQESTERQYALKDKALALGWAPTQVRILDRDLGLSGTQSHNRADFKALVADVSLGQVGAVFALEASRLARSNTDWHRLIELCSLTSTLLIDEDGCYDPADFNDALLLGLKGAMSQAELHFLRLRLQGGKLNKAKKGELRFPLPVGFCYDDTNTIVLDPDAEVRGAVELVFRTFRELGSATAVVQAFANQGLRFPKRAYGGVWDGQLVWGRLTEGRVLSLLHNPVYAGVYAFGRYRCVKDILADGTIRSRLKQMPRSSWLVAIQDHHAGYLSFEEHGRNLELLERNRTNRADTLLSGPAREGRALLQGLLVCGQCGRRVTVRYKHNGGAHALYECNWQRREGLASRSCLVVRADLLDREIGRRALEVVNSEQISLAIQALQELQQRQSAVDGQWRLRLQRADYEVSLAQRRYEQVDPANRLVAATLEQRWNEALARSEELRQQYAAFQQEQARNISAAQQAELQDLAKDFPRLWQAASTPAKDKKRMLRLLIQDITVAAPCESPTIVLSVRWQGGACEEVRVDRPQRMADRVRYAEVVVARVRELALEHSDEQIAAALNEAGWLAAKKAPFTASKVQWIRHKHRIPAASIRQWQLVDNERSVEQVAQHFGVSRGVVYYWIERGILAARKANRTAPYRITLDAAKEQELREWVRRSSRIAKQLDQESESKL